MTWDGAAQERYELEATLVRAEYDTVWLRAEFAITYTVEGVLLVEVSNPFIGATIYLPDGGRASLVTSSSEKAFSYVYGPVDEMPIDPPPAPYDPLAPTESTENNGSNESIDVPGSTESPSTPSTDHTDQTNSTATTAATELEVADIVKVTGADEPFLEAVCTLAGYHNNDDSRGYNVCTVDLVLILVVLVTLLTAVGLGLCVCLRKNKDEVEND